jgi:hypothetical protein
MISLYLRVQVPSYISPIGYLLCTVFRLVLIAVPSSVLMTLYCAVVTYECRHLISIASSDHPCLIANRVMIASLGGIEAIIAVMSAHKDHSGVQEKACGALSNLAVNNDGTV